MSCRGGFMAHFAAPRQREIATKIFCCGRLCAPRAEKVLRILRRGVRCRVVPGGGMGAHSGIRQYAMLCGYSLILAFALINSAATAQAPQSPQPSSQINVMPIPATVTPAAGRLMVTQSFCVAIAGYNEPRLERATQRFLRDLSLQTGYFLRA